MNCQGAREQTVDTLATGRVEMTREVAGHIQSCAECRTFYAQQAALFCAMDSSLSAMVNEPVPASLLPKVRERMEKTRPGSTWLYRLVPVAAVLLVAALIGVPLARRSARIGGVQVIVIPERSKNGGEPRRPLAEKTEKSTIPPATREQSPRHSARPPAALRQVQTAVVAVLVSSEESKGLRQLAAAVPRDPQWAQAMVHPADPPSSQMAPIKPVVIADLEVKPLSEENQ